MIRRSLNPFERLPHPSLDATCAKLDDLYRRLRRAGQLYPSAVEKRDARSRDDISSSVNKGLNPSGWGLNPIRVPRALWREYHRAKYEFAQIEPILIANSFLQYKITHAKTFIEEWRAVIEYRDRLRKIPMSPEVGELLIPLEMATLAFARLMRDDYLRRVDEGEIPDDENATFLRKARDEDYAEEDEDEEPLAVGFA